MCIQLFYFSQYHPITKMHDDDDVGAHMIRRRWKEKASLNIITHLVCNEIGMLLTRKIVQGRSIQKNSLKY